MKWVGMTMRPGPNPIGFVVPPPHRSTPVVLVVDAEVNSVWSSIDGGKGHLS
jgi:hypothetical protein